MILVIEVIATFVSGKVEKGDGEGGGGPGGGLERGHVMIRV